MPGVITTRHLVTHGILIVRLFGFGVYFRAIRGAFKGLPFLACL